ncbi:hypothetical protein ASPVEDRAFT_893778 [Aspergillus versicolor CBS 583.65]|uniref:Xylanolytic transcriptional activator regulatory domain-containing protein n=1 Tax=Aspergillus versicolor CBS 583.65 TaxID=1036611 RepID=A0A1L9PUY4_ASPVE|nr:uncharacterized protein ASPVEDRAFT_893778 [Aspergillus versicolor CBS 583.65]OJJ05337.1 hypothetical protein ASPVEDRAFT_893778 [Aspergillus versicolor CBS 583.65]
MAADGYSDSLRRHAKGHENESRRKPAPRLSSMPTPEMDLDPGAILGARPMTVTMAEVEYLLPSDSAALHASPLDVAPSDSCQLDFVENLTSTFHESARLSSERLIGLQSPQLPGLACDEQAGVELAQPTPTVSSDHSLTPYQRDTQDAGNADGLETTPSSGSYAGLYTSDGCRAKLFRRIQGYIPRDDLPDIGRLGMFAKLYFTQFNPMMPFIHAPSFKVTTRNTILFLCLCAVGSSFAGCPQDALFGRRIIDSVSKTILTSWELILSPNHEDDDPFSIIQAGMVSLAFALHSGSPEDLLLADYLRGPIIAAMRGTTRRYTEEVRQTDKMFSLDGREIVEDVWREWAATEQRARAYHAIRIHDAELANLLHHEPLLRHRSFDAPSTATDHLFTAPTPEAWAASYQRGHPFCDGPSSIMNSQLAAYSELVSINTQIIDSRRSHTLDARMRKRLSQMLMEWWQIFHRSQLAKKPNQLSLGALWHASYLSLYADCELLERILCYKGDHLRPESHAMAAAREWVMSKEVLGCLLHAREIQKHIGTLQRMAEPAVHVPRTLFQAGLIWLSVWQLRSDREALAALMAELVSHPSLTGAEPIGKEGLKAHSEYQVRIVLNQLERLGRLGRPGKFVCLLRQGLGMD